ncbi:MAG: hypothetical protein R3F19_30050 [Verrucomicrobiales bacterium]
MILLGAIFGMDEVRAATLSQEFADDFGLSSRQVGFALTAAAMDPQSGDFFLVNRWFDGQVSQLTPSGELRTLGNLAVGSASFLWVDSSIVYREGFLYAKLAEGTSHELVQMDTSTGKAEVVYDFTGEPVADFSMGGGVAVKGNSLLVTLGNSSRSIYEFAPSTGSSPELTKVSTASKNLINLELDPLMVIGYGSATDNRIHQIEFSGDDSIFSSSPTPARLERTAPYRHFAVGPDGYLYLMGIDDTIFQVDPATGGKRPFVQGLFDTNEADLIFGPSSDPSDGAEQWSLFFTDDSKLMEVSGFVVIPEPAIPCQLAGALFFALLTSTRWRASLIR